MAASSFKKPVVGHIARWLNAIPVYRPQDYAFKGEGLIYFDGTALVGVNTKFTAIKDKLEGAKLEVNGDAFLVEAVISDEELKIKPPLKEPKITKEAKEFKVNPKIDNSTCFSEVYSTLQGGDCILIFPEGTSHDNSHLIELKAGVALMSLGAMQKPGSPAVSILPIGLNYFDREKFRSTLLVEVGKPLQLLPEWAEEFSSNKKEVTSKVLGEVQDVFP